jgi:hypothetical protein
VRLDLLHTKRSPGRLTLEVLLRAFGDVGATLCSDCTLALSRMSVTVAASSLSLPCGCSRTDIMLGISPASLFDRTRMSCLPLARLV